MRWSFHRMAGRSTSPAPSSRTSPCICPVRPTAATRPPSMPACAKTLRTLVEAACHHSGGSCSDQSGLGVCSVCGEDATAATIPASSISRALLPVVDTSIPRKYRFPNIIPSFIPSELPIPVIDGDHSIVTGQVNKRSLIWVLSAPTISNVPCKRISSDELPSITLIVPASITKSRFSS